MRTLMPSEYSLPSVRVAQSPQERFAQFLQSRGKRVTQQRQAIVDQVFSHHDHFDADELMGHLQELIAAKKVSRPTVYRTLSELVDAGLLRTMSLEGRTVYEHDYGYPAHDHLHCEVCNELIEFHSAELERICREVGRAHNFEVTGHRMFVSGVCDRCRSR